MRKALIFIVVALVLASAVFSASSSDFLGSYFHYKEVSFRDILGWIFDFFKSGITGLAGYSTSANANLTIWDETDNSSFPFAGQTRYVDEQVFFFANFTNSTNILNDSTANVSICINFTQQECGNMTFNSSAQLWQFGTTAYYLGKKGWNVTAVSVAGNLAAQDNVTINNTCLNVSNLASDYYIKTSRALCGGIQSMNYSIIFENVSSIDLDCNNSDVNGILQRGIVVLNSTGISIHRCTLENFSDAAVVSDSGGVVIYNSTFRSNFPASADAVLYFESTNGSSVSGCTLLNNSGSDVRVRNSAYFSLAGTISNFNNASDATIILQGSNFTTIDNLRVYNSRAIFGLGIGNIYVYGEEMNNSVTNVYIENVSSTQFENLSINFSSNLSIFEQIVSGLNSIGFGAITQGNLRVDNLTVKRAGACIGEADSSGSVYTNVNASGCSNIGFGTVSFRSASAKKITFENSSIYNSGFALVSGNTSHNPGSSIRNVSVYNATYVLTATLEDSRSFSLFSNIFAYNSSTGFFAQDGYANVKDSYLGASQSVNLNNSNVTFLNVTFNKSAPSIIAPGSLFTVKWFFNVFVKDILSNIIQGANVTLQNSSGVVFSEFTNASGNIQRKNLTEFEEDDAGRVFQNYNLTVISNQYVRQSLDPHINETKTLNITLLGAGSLAVSSPVNGSYYKNNTIALNYIVLFNNTDSCWFTNTTGGRVNLTNCTNTTFIVPDGLRNITVFANNTQGNITFLKIFFTVDTIRPNIIYLNISLLSNTSVSINWTTSESTNMSFSYRISSGPLIGSGQNTTFSNISSYSLFGLTQSTEYSIELTFCDRAGNCVSNSTKFRSGGNFTPTDLHIPEGEIIVQELVASELTSTPQRTSLTPGSRYIYTLDQERHYVKLKSVYTDQKAVFELGSDPVTEEVMNGSTVEVDVDNDGINDVALTLDNIEFTKVTFDLKRISFKKVEEVPAQPGKPFIEEKPFVAPAPGVAKEKTFMEKYSLYIIIALVAVIAVIAGGGLILQRKKQLLAPAEIKKLPVPKTSHLESLMNTVYGMLKDSKTKLDVNKYLEEMNLEENVIRSIVFEMKTKNNRIDQLIKFSKQKFAKGKTVEEVREELENAGWATNIVELATEE